MHKSTKQMKNTKKHQHKGVEYYFCRSSRQWMTIVNKEEISLGVCKNAAIEYIDWALINKAHENNIII
jgi:predicted peroxiredoxin